VLNIGGALGDSLCVSAYYLQRTLASKSYNLVKDSPSFSELVMITHLQIQIVQNEGFFFILSGSRNCGTLLFIKKSLLTKARESNLPQQLQKGQTNNSGYMQ